MVLWYETARSRLHLLVIVRDPSGHQHVDFFITSDTTLTPAEVAELYSDRWAIEDANRNLKQYLGVQNPQSWVGDGPERVVALAGWLYSAVWHWYLVVHSEDPAWPDGALVHDQAARLRSPTPCPPYAARSSRQFWTVWRCPGLVDT